MFDYNIKVSTLRVGVFITMRVCLSNLIQPALIFPGNTGITYHNQVGGTACYQAELEGYIVPIEYDYRPENYSDALCEKLANLFPEGNSGFIDQFLADKIQHLLEDSPFTKDISINQDKLSESKEAWLHVIVSGSLADTFNKAIERQAILTWPNSD